MSFNTRLREEANVTFWGVSILPRRFQYTPPWGGERNYNCNCIASCSVSIHASVRRRTYWSMLSRYVEHVSIHASVRRRTIRYIYYVHQPWVSIHASVRRRTLVFGNFYKLLTVSIHASVRRRTFSCALNGSLTPVSIHASVRRRTLVALFVLVYFQSFNTRLREEANTGKNKNSFMPVCFNTRLREEANSKMGNQWSIFWRFNTRLREEANRAIMVHGCLIEFGFNTRLREEANIKWAYPKNYTVKFQYTPPWGGELCTPQNKPF